MPDLTVGVVVASSRNHTHLLSISIISTVLLRQVGTSNILTNSQHTSQCLCRLLTTTQTIQTSSRMPRLPPLHMLTCTPQLLLLTMYSSPPMGLLNMPISLRHLHLAHSNIGIVKDILRHHRMVRRGPLTETLAPTMRMLQVLIQS